MKISNFLALCLTLFLANPSPLLAEVNVSGAEMYAAFAKKGPRAVIAHAREAASYIQKGGDLEAFNDGHSKKWWPNRPFFTPIIVMRCDELRDVTHPIDAMRAGLIKKNMARKFRDLDGQATFHILCKKIPGHPEGVWLFQRHYWPGTKEAIRLAVLLLPVKGTPYEIQVFFATEKYSVAELNKMLTE